MKEVTCVVPVGVLEHLHPMLSQLSPCNLFSVMGDTRIEDTTPQKQMHKNSFCGNRNLRGTSFPFPRMIDAYWFRTFCRHREIIRKRMLNLSQVFVVSGNSQVRSLS